MAKLAVDLLSEKSNPETFALVAEHQNQVIGHVGYSPVVIDGGEHVLGYILAPLAVSNDYQRRGVGSQLVERGKRLLCDTGVGMLFVYGDPNYYNSFGFSEERAQGYDVPYELAYPFGWQALVLNEQTVARPPVELICVGALSDPAYW